MKQLSQNYLILIYDVPALVQSIGPEGCPGPGQALDRLHWRMLCLCQTLAPVSPTRVTVAGVHQIEMAREEGGTPLLGAGDCTSSDV